MPQRGKSRIDDALLLALSCGAGAENAARNAKVSVRTVYRRLATPEFKRRLDELKASIVQRTADMLAGAGMEAVKVLVTLQQDPAVPPSVRLAAARTVLDFGNHM